LVNGYDDIIKFLKQHHDNLSDDLLALYRASLQWKSNEPIDVGESGTLYRFLKFASWKMGLNKKFILQGTLKYRKICNDPEIVNWSLKKLLTLDNGTSQWASASVLMGNQENPISTSRNGPILALPKLGIQNPPYKLQVTYDAVEHWKSAREKGESWQPRFDETILAQASAYLQWLKEGKMDFKPQQAEDYCFARAFDIMTAQQGEARWPSLRGHESDRILEMEDALKQNEVTSKDHRVVQAVAMLRKNKKCIKYPDCVKKTWPQFWKFMEYSRKS
jgi:hypothetical protein